MKKYIKIFLSILILSLVFVYNTVDAEEVYKNEETGYSVYIDDDVDILTTEEEEKLKDDMIKITSYSNVAFVSVDNLARNSTDSYAIDYYNKTFGGSNVKGTMFIVNMTENNRFMLIRSNGGIDKIITNAKSDIITDNYYKYAKSKDYYECAKGVYSQIYTLLDGGKISEPMRHISNFILAIYISFIFCYMIVMNTVKQKKQNRLNTYENTFDMKDINATYIGQKKVYSPQSSSSGGGSSGGGGGGGGGGGSSGGHSF